jgi:hypothetical protein
VKVTTKYHVEDEQALDETGDILQMMIQLSGCEEADDVDIRQWILADDCDVVHHMYTDNNIVSLVLSKKSSIYSIL